MFTHGWGHACDAGPHPRLPGRGTNPQWGSLRSGNGQPLPSSPENTSSGIRPALVSRETWVREPLWAFHVRRAGDGPQLRPCLAGVVTVAPAETTFRQLSLVQSHIGSHILPHTRPLLLATRALALRCMAGRPGVKSSGQGNPAAPKKTWRKDGEGSWTDLGHS